MSEPSHDAAARLRWQTVEQEATLPGLGAGERVTHPEFAGLEFLHVRAKSLLNEVPEAAGLPFRWTINVYRGCSHACTYCLAGDTPVLLADGRTRPLAELRPGDRIVGTRGEGPRRRYVTTVVRDQWRTRRRAYRVTLADGTRLVASGDHRFLTERGFAHVTGGASPGCAHLTTRSRLLGTGGFAAPPKPSDDYRRGYLRAAIRPETVPAGGAAARRARPPGGAHRVRLAVTDRAARERTREYLADLGVDADPATLRAPGERHGDPPTPGGSGSAPAGAIGALIAWPESPSEGWRAGFLAGAFDAGGRADATALRIGVGDGELAGWVRGCLDALGFEHVAERAGRDPATVRLRGGLRERLRFLHATDPVGACAPAIEGRPVVSEGPLDVVAVEDLGVEVPMVDITTGTGDFVADGVVSHNCFARPSHTWLDLDAGRDFERVVVVKINAVERLRAELRRPSWAGEPVALGTNTDPYQRAEGRYRLTRGVVRTLADAGNPFSVLTKGTLVSRDLDILADAAARGVCTGVSLSIPTLDEEVWRTSEPGTPHPRARMETVARLAEAGIPTGVMLAPVLPGLSDGDAQLEAVVRAAVEAGAGHVTPILLHLRPGVREVFLPWLAQTRPDLVPAYEDWYRTSYAPRRLREELGRRVRDLVARHGPLATTATPRVRDAGRGTPAAGPSSDAPDAPAGPGGREQLSLL